MKERKIFKKAFGLDEHGFADFPGKISLAQIARLLEVEVKWDDFYFVKRRNWKDHRKTQWKQK